MVASMTGFAVESGVCNGVSWTVELRGVNGKNLDLRLRVPERLHGLDVEIRTSLRKHLKRGSVNASVKLEKLDEGQELKVQTQVLAAYVEAARAVEELCQKQGVSLSPPKSTDFLNLKGVVHEASEVSEDGLKKAILVGLSNALKSFVAMRDKEGAALVSVLLNQLNQAQALTDAARTTADARLSYQKERLQEILSRLLDVSATLDEDRLSQELALLAVKSDVGEELDRLEAHIAAARDMLSPKGPVGRKLDFLMQEFNREANTLCSKSSSHELTQIGLDLKVVIDQMREQVQNLE